MKNDFDMYTFLEQHPIIRELWTLAIVAVFVSCIAIASTVFLSLLIKVCWAIKEAIL